MGSVLICCIVKGPKNIDPDPSLQRVKAVQQVEWMKEMLKEWRDLEVASFAEFLEKTKRTRGDLKCNTEVIQDHSEIYELVHLIDVDATKTVDDFIKFWNEEKGESHIRDLDWRTDPDDKSQIIMVAGADSWGDLPDGPGFNYLINAYRLGITKEFGIR